MLIGAHVSAAGGSNKAIARAEEIGAECFQIFASSPRMWSAKPISDEIADKYQAEMKRSGLGPTVLHGKYLVALGTADPELLAKSEVALQADIAAANKLGLLRPENEPPGRDARRACRQGISKRQLERRAGLRGFRAAY